MTNNDIEIEIKVKVEKLAPLVRFLKNNGKQQKKMHQVDTYFVPKHRNFLKFRPAKEWLRLRDADGVFFVNYKYWHYGKNGKTNYCDEYETKIGDIKQLDKIFTALNMKKIAVVDKKRQTWLYKNYEIAVDKVKNLGDFVEIEYKGQSKYKPEELTSQMVRFLKEVGCGEIKRSYLGYPFMLIFPKEVKYEKE